MAGLSNNKIKKQALLMVALMLVQILLVAMEAYATPDPGARMPDPECIDTVSAQADNCCEESGENQVNGVRGSIECDNCDHCYCSGSPLGLIAHVFNFIPLQLADYVPEKFQGRISRQPALIDRPPIV